VAITDVRQLRSFQFEEAKASKGSIQQTGSVELLVLHDAPPDFGAIKTNTATWPNFYGRRIPQINDGENIGGVDFFVTRRRFEYYDDENEYAVKVTISYDSKSEDDTNESQQPQGGDAETWKRISISTQSASVPLTDEGENGEKGGVPACNSAGDPVDGLTEDRSLVKLTYTNTKVPKPNFVKLMEYVNKTNDGAFLGAPRRRIRCMGFSGEFDDRNQLWSISVEFLYDEDQHVVKYFDAGFNEIVSGKRLAILDIQGNPVSKPVPLNGNGQAVDPGIVGLGSQAGDTAVRYAYPYREKNMANIFQECRI